MFTRKTIDEKTKTKVIQLEETIKALEARLNTRIEELNKQVIEEWREKDE